MLEESELDGIDAEVNAELDVAVKAARAAAEPDLAMLTTDVYVSYEDPR